MLSWIFHCMLSRWSANKVRCARFVFVSSELISLVEGIRSSDDEYRVLSTYVLRGEGGIRLNFWETETSLQLMHKLSSKVREYSC